MSITSFFERLGAPLANSRWSWGAQRGSDGAVFLRVWQDRKRVEDGRRYMLLDRHGNEPDNKKNFGYQERLRHIAAVRSGVPCYLVMCIARDVDARPRTLQDFDDRDIFVAGDLIERDGDSWIEVVARRPISTVIDGSTAPAQTAAPKQ